MTGERRPLKIVRTYYTASHGTGDPPIAVTEDGTHWRQATSIESSGQLTGCTELRERKGGYIW